MLSFSDGCWAWTADLQFQGQTLRMTIGSELPFFGEANDLGGPCISLDPCMPLLTGLAFQGISFEELVLRHYEDHPI